MSPPSFPSGHFGESSSLSAGCSGWHWCLQNKSRKCLIYFLSSQEVVHERDHTSPARTHIYGVASLLFCFFRAHQTAIPFLEGFWWRPWSPDNNEDFSELLSEKCRPFEPLPRSAGLNGQKPRRGQSGGMNTVKVWLWFSCLSLVCSSLSCCICPWSVMPAVMTPFPSPNELPQQTCWWKTIVSNTTCFSCCPGWDFSARKMHSSGFESTLEEFTVNRSRVTILHKRLILQCNKSLFCPNYSLFGSSLFRVLSDFLPKMENDVIHQVWPFWEV